MRLSPAAIRSGLGALAVAATLTALAGCAQREPDTAGTPPVMRRLTEPQYRNTIRDVFGPGIVVVGRFDPITREGGLLSVGASSASITPSGFERFGELAESIAAQVVAPGNRDFGLPCKPADPRQPDADCARQIYALSGRLLYRRALTDAELARFVALGERVTTTLGDFYEGVSFGLAAMLQSPEFLFVTDTTEPDPAAAGQLRLTPQARASRLSFFLWNASPDEALLAAAERGELDRRDGLAAQVQRLMQSPRLEEGVRAFFSDLLTLDAFDQMQKDAAIYPSFGLAVADDAREQLLRTIVDHLLVRGEDYRELFTTRRAPVSGALGLIYAMPVKDPNGWTDVEFPETSPYRGIVTLPGFSALHSHAGRSSPTLRGRAVRELLMCQKVPDPPSNVDFSQFNHASATRVRTARERLDAHNTEKACASCHKITDPIGLALEHFDGAAQFRTVENEVVIDTRGELDGVEYDDAAGLGEALSKSPAVTQCVVNRALAYARGRAPRRTDNALVIWLHERFESDGYRLRGLLESLALSDAFYAVSPPVPAAPASDPEAAPPPAKTAALDGATTRENRS